MDDVVKMVQLARQILEFLQPGQKPKRVTVFDNNERAINLAEPPLGSAHGKHIDVRHHYLWILVAKQTIKVSKLRTQDREAIRTCVKGLGQKLVAEDVEYEISYTSKNWDMYVSYFLYKRVTQYTYRMTQQTFNYLTIRCIMYKQCVSYRQSNYAPRKACSGAYMTTLDNVCD